MPNSNGLTPDDIINVTEYASQESTLSASDTVTIATYKQQTVAVKNKNQAIADLRQIKDLIIQNKTALEKMDDNITIAKNIIKNEINNFNADVINDLMSNNIDSIILSTCITQFNTANNNLQELEYRQNILSYKSVFIKEQKNELDSQIEQINKYIMALNATL